MISRYQAIARVLTSSGFGATTLANSLGTVLNLDGADTGEILDSAGYTASQIAAALKNAFGWPVSGITEFMADVLGFGSDVLESALDASGFMKGKTSQTRGPASFFENFP